mmetsp:Transcript_22159/g.33271  ORF Transcript_22159/g.33271 Transcript_22159/m.33271 type:complete len:82 (+) Transcript_22159:95-340(+)
MFCSKLVLKFYLANRDHVSTTMISQSSLVFSLGSSSEAAAASNRANRARLVSSVETTSILFPPNRPPILADLNPSKSVYCR